MFLSHIARPGVAPLVGLVIAVLPLSLTTQPAAAQRPVGPRVPPDAKGHQAGLILREQLQRRPAQQRAAPPAAQPPRTVVVRPAPAPEPLQVVVSVPAQPPRVFVDIRGPDGKMRRFPLEGGAAAIQRQEVVVRAGETATITVVPPPTTP
jgi:hypothetical protein